VKHDRVPDLQRYLPVPTQLHAINKQRGKIYDCGYTNSIATAKHSKKGLRQMDRERRAYEGHEPRSVADHQKEAPKELPVYVKQ
jgi:hypothetical protein